MIYDLLWTWKRHPIAMVVLAPIWIPVFVFTYIVFEVRRIMWDINL